MPRWASRQCIGAIVLLALSGWAMAGDHCRELATQQGDAQVATRVAAVACDENLRWDQPFIDSNGRMASMSLHEAEGSGLRDGGSPWRRVAFYWQSSGLLPAMAFRSGATDCTYAAISTTYPGLGCRGFVVDTPWSAAFISWVMLRAGVPGFRGSASHFDYVKAARQDTGSSPYRFSHPTTTVVGRGDLLCYVRTRRVYGYVGLAKAIDGGTASLPMHCDIVVNVSGGTAYTVGGNVQQGVTMRLLNVNVEGHLWGLPERGEGDVECSPDTEFACNFNRQDWAVLLKLKSQDELARIGAVQAPTGLPQQAVPPTCCVNCVLGGDLPRCPVGGQSPTPNLLQGGD